MHPSSPEKLRIAIWTGRYPQWSEQFIIRDAGRLAGLGHEIFIFPCENPSSSRDWLRIGDPAVSRGARAASESPGRFNRAVAFSLLAGLGWTQIRRWPALSFAASAWREEMSGEPPDLVVAHFAGLPAALGAAFAAGWGKPLAVCVHARDVWVPWRPGWRALARARSVVGCNRAVLDELARHDAAPRERLRLIHHGLDFAPITLPKEDPPRGAGEKTRARMLFVGRMVEKKGLPLLFEAIGRLVGGIPPFALELVGDGPDLDSLRKRAATLPAPVTFTGRLDGEEVARRMRMADILVQPSVVAADGDRDGIPNAVLEAMGWGTPVVTTTAAGGVEALDTDEKAGWLCASDTESLAAALAAALSDPIERRRRGRIAAQRVRERFDGAANARLLEECFRETAFGPAGARAGSMEC